MWKDYTPSGPTINIKDKTFQGKVIHQTISIVVLSRYDLNIVERDAKHKIIITISIVRF